MAQDMEIRVDTNKYEARISMLEQYVHQNEGFMAGYENLKNTVSDFLGEDEHIEAARSAADVGIKRCRKAIEATHANIASLRDVVENMSEVGANIKTVLEAAVEAASAGLFD